MAVVASNTQILEGLYAAIYVRSPDKAGFDFWTAGFTAGTLTPGSAATAFSTRTEWATAYPATLTDAAYVDKIYLNVLGIAGDAAGRAFWTANITAKAYSRAVFVSEFIAATIQYDSAADTTSTVAQKASAVQAQSAINSKVSFNDAWVNNTTVSTNSAMTGVSTDATGAAIYTASLDKSVPLLAGVTDAPTLATQLPKITAAANSGSTFALTTGVDSLTALTAMNDTVTGAAGTLGGDVIIDNTTSDFDVLTAAGVAAGTKPTITKVETLNISNTFSTGLDLSSVSGSTTLNLSATVANGNATVTAAKVGAVTSIVAGANISTLSVAAASTGTGGDLAINSGTATTVTLTGSAAADSFALTTTGNVTVKAGSGLAVETLKLTANPVAVVGTAAPVAPVITLDNATQLLTFTAGTTAVGTTAGTLASGGTLQIDGAGDLEIKADIAALSGRTVTKGAGKLTVTLSGTPGNVTQELTKVIADTINLGNDLGSTATVSISDGANISTPVDQTGLALSTAITATVTDTSATLTKLTSSSLKALTINSAAPAVAGVDATYGYIDLSGVTTAASATGVTPVVAQNLIGSNYPNTKVTFIGGSATAGQDIKAKGDVETVDASKLLGTIDYSHNNLIGFATAAATATPAEITAAAVEKFIFTGSAGADKLTIIAPAIVAGITTVPYTSAKAAITATLGDGDDNVILPGITFVAGSTLNIDGGVGTADTLTLTGGADISAATLTLSNVENIAFGAAGGTITLSAAQVSGQSYAIQGSSVFDTFSIKGIATTTTVDLTKLAFTASVETVKIDGSANTTTGETLTGVFGTTSIKPSNDITGGAVSDTITGGISADIIVGGKGADVLTGGASADRFVFDKGDTGSTVIVPSAVVFDSITDFEKGIDKVIGAGGSTTDAAFAARNGSTFVITNASGATAAAKAAVAGTAGYTVNSVAVFDPADATLQQQITAVAKSLNATSMPGASVVWSGTGGTFLFISGGTVSTTGATADDVLVRLSNVSLASTDSLATFVSGSSVTAVSTGPTSGNDAITGTVGNDDGTSGNGAILDGLGGNDTLTGLAGNDIFNISAGSDTITDLGLGSDQVTVASGASVTAKLVAAWTPGATVNNNAAASPTGTATIDANGFAVNLAAATGTGGWNVTNSATTGATITGSTGVDTITGGTGNDTITYLLNGALFTANAAVDSINGGTGTDTLSVGTTGTAFAVAATDIWTRVSSVETIKAVANAVADTITLDVSAQTAGITTVDLSLDSASTNVITASSFTTTGLTLIGSTAGTSSITGGAGADTINGGAGVDTLRGGAGADTINGGAGADTVIVASDETGAGTATAGSLTAAGVIGALSFSTTAMDVLTGGLVASDKVQLYTTGTTAITTSTTLLTAASTWGAATVGDVALVRGTYASNVFTAATAGTDSALIWDSNGTTAGGTYQAIVLVGYVDTGTTDTITAGLFTVV